MIEKDVTKGGKPFQSKLAPYESEVKELLKYYNNTRKTMKGIGKRGSRIRGGGAMNRMMGQFMK